MFNTICYFSTKSINYYGIKKETKIPFVQLDYGFPSRSNDQIYWSSAVHDLYTSGNCYLSQLYHLAAVVEKIYPGRWAWEEQFEYYENSFQADKTSTKAYMKAHNMHVRPEFYDDFFEWQFMAHVQKWFDEQGLSKTEDQIKEETAAQVKELILDRSKKDFIKLSEKLLQIIDKQ